MFPERKLPRAGPLRLPEDAPGRALVRRIGLALGLIAGVAIVLWFDRDGLRDNAHPERIPTFVDVFYFTVVSLTTVGYGDIAPVTAEARLINAILLTPIRVFLWVLFLGTAYEVTILRLQFREERYMRDLHQRLRNHIIVCGYGLKGRALVDELLAHGHAADEIVVIDNNDDAIDEAAKRGLVGLRGDASTEALLRSAAIEHAAYVMVATNRDDSTVLICLTVCSLAPEVTVIAAARDEENVKLIYRAGASMVVAPSVSGGRLMAAAVRQNAVPRFIDDLLTFGQGLSLAEHEVTPGEAGRLAHDLPGLRSALVVEIARGDERLSFSRIAETPLRAGDTVVYLTETGSTPAA